MCYAAAACAVSAGQAGSLQAQTPPTIESPDPAPFALPPIPGVSSTTLGDRSILQILVRPRLDLRSWETYSWGLRLRLGVQVSTGFSGFDDIDPSSVRLLSVVPGLEAIFPFGQRSLLRPYVDLGVGQISEDRRDVLFGTGLGGEFVFPWKSFEIGIEPDLSYRTTLAVDDGDATVGALTLGADVRHPLWFKMGGAQPDVGVYVQQSFLWSGIEFATADGGTVSVDRVAEVGVIFGFQQRPKLLFFRLPTLGVGYRFGELTGLTIRIGGDRLIRLADPTRNR